MIDIDDAVVEYTSRGWAVFPVSGKRPMVKWRDVSTPYLERARALFNRRPDAGVAIACGESGLVVFDLDVGEGKGGAAAWRRLKADLDFDDDGALVVRTGGGGRHIIFADPTGGLINNSSRGLPEGIDVRGSGGYIVAPPSVHPETGERYQWERSGGEPAPVPPELVKLLLERSRDETPPKRQEIGEAVFSNNPQARAWAEAALQDEVAAVTRTPKGNRNNRLNEGAFALGQIVGADILDYHIVYDELIRAAVTAGLGRSEARKTVESGLAAGMEQPRYPPERQADCPTGTLDRGPKASPAPVSLDEKLPHVGRAFIKESIFREELGAAELLVEIYPNRIAYDHAAGQWYVWDGHGWQEDRTEMMHRLLGGQVAGEYLAPIADLTREASAAGDTARRDELERLIERLYKRARKLRRLYYAKRVLEWAQSFVGLTGEEWDQNPWLLGVANGTVDLHTGELVEGKPEHYIRSRAPVEYQGVDTPAPRWERFIRDIFARVGVDGPDPDPDVEDYVQRLLGYGLTGLATEHVLPILWGAGRNGKDTLLEALSGVLGNLAKPVSTGAIVGRSRHTGAPTPHLMDLRGARLVWASETEEGAKINAGRVKLITGGGQITARAPYGRRQVVFDPTHLAILVTNHKPEAPAGDLALWDRVALIPFLWRFVDDPQQANERQRVRNLGHKLEREEGPGILAWLVRGCLAWQDRGLETPERVRAATDKYRGQEDLVQQFIDDCCAVEPSAKARAGDLYDAYKGWTEEMGVETVSGVQFGKRMDKRFERKRDSEGKFYRGLGLLGRLL